MLAVALAAVALGSLGLAALLVVLLVRREREHAQQLADFVSAGEAERSELLNRIQRPTWLAPPKALERNGEEELRPPDELHKVGTIAPFDEGPDDAA